MVYDYFKKMFFVWRLDASAAVYASAHDSFAPHWQVLSLAWLSGLLYLFWFFGGLGFCHFAFLVIIMFLAVLELIT